MSFAMPGDWAILSWIQTYCRNGLLDAVVPFYSSLGNGAMLWLLIALVCLLVPKYRRLGGCLLLGLAIGWFVGNGVLKPLIARPRPCWLNPDLMLLIPTPRDFSFPSGHTLSSFIAASILWRGPSRWMAAGGVVLAATMALTRLYLYVHFPSDILAGIAFGILIGSLVSHFFYKPQHNINY